MPPFGPQPGVVEVQPAHHGADVERRGDGIEPVALHPGVYDTQLLRDYMGGGWGTGTAARVLGKNPEQAAPIVSELAVGRRDEALGGAYLEQGKVAEPSVHARDRAAQEALWEWSEVAVATHG